jgi:hypothetical protein
MMANEERLALILEANDKASAIIQKVRKEIEATDGAAGKGGKARASSATSSTSCPTASS